MGFVLEIEWNIIGTMNNGLHDFSARICCACFTEEGKHEVDNSLDDRSALRIKYRNERDRQRR
jgi:hypothetical protein